VEVGGEQERAERCGDQREALVDRAVDVLGQARRGLPGHHRIRGRVPADQVTVLADEQEPRRPGTARAGDDEAAGAVEDLTGGGTTGNRHDQRHDRRCRSTEPAGIERRGVGAVVGHPQRRGGAERQTPGVLHVRVGDRGTSRNVGDQVHLGERRPRVGWLDCGRGDPRRRQDRHCDHRSHGHAPRLPPVFSTCSTHGASRQSCRRRGRASPTPHPRPAGPNGSSVTSGFGAFRRVGRSRTHDRRPAAYRPRLAGCRVSRCSQALT
jgi:hypothetical protein